MNELLFSPIRIGRIEIPNRIVLAPMTRTRAGNGGVPTDEMARYYARYARHGTGLVITEATYTDHRLSKAYVDQPGIADEHQQEGWSRVAAAAKAEGAVAVLQLQHVGRLAEVGLHEFPLSPTDLTPPGETWQFGRPHGPVRSATVEDLQLVVDGFGSAARRAVEAGFDGVEVHGSHGYLLDQFLSEGINLRDDAYGGDLGRRLRLPLDVVAAVREAIGDKLLSYNYSFWKMEDRAYEPPGGVDEVASIVHALTDAGVDTIHASARNATRPVLGGDEPFGALVRRHVPIPVIAGGSVRTVDDARHVLSAGIGDLVVIGRAHAANPDWARRVKSGSPIDDYVRGIERTPVDE